MLWQGPIGQEALQHSISQTILRQHLRQHRTAHARPYARLYARPYSPRSMIRVFPFDRADVNRALVDTDHHFAVLNIHL